MQKNIHLSSDLHLPVTLRRDAIPAKASRTSALSTGVEGDLHLYSVVWEYLRDMSLTERLFWQ
jgi:hypothetical protein